MTMKYYLNEHFLFSQGRFIMNDDIHITNADIVVENGLLMKTDAVLVPDGVSTLPNFCNVVTTEIVMVGKTINFFFC